MWGRLILRCVGKAFQGQKDGQSVWRRESAVARMCGRCGEGVGVLASYQAAWSCLHPYSPSLSQDQFEGHIGTHSAKYAGPLDAEQARSQVETQRKPPTQPSTGGDQSNAEDSLTAADMEENDSEVHKYPISPFPSLVDAPHACNPNALVRYGTVRYGMVWYGMVWYGMVWYGMVWYVVVVVVVEAPSTCRREKLPDTLSLGRAQGSSRPALRWPGGRRRRPMGGGGPPCRGGGGGACARGGGWGHLWMLPWSPPPLRGGG